MINDKIQSSLDRFKELSGYRLNESADINEVDWDNEFSDVKKVV